MFGPFGGRAERDVDGDDPRRTAWREFHEETGNAFVPLDVPLAFDDAFFTRNCDGHIYYENARYHLYVMRLPYLETLPRFTDADAAANAVLNKRDLLWVLVDDLLAPFETEHRHRSASSGQRSSEERLVPPLPLLPWIEQLCRRHHRALRSATTATVRRNGAYEYDSSNYSVARRQLIGDGAAPPPAPAAVVRSWFPSSSS